MQPKQFWLTFHPTISKSLKKMKKVKSLSHVLLFVTPWTVACTRILHAWDSPGKSTGVGSGLPSRALNIAQIFDPVFFPKETI